MPESFPALKDLPKLWFTAVKPTLVYKQGKVEVDVDTLHPHGGLFVLPTEVPLTLGESLELIFQKPDESTAFTVKALVIHLRPALRKVGLVFLQLVRHELGNPQVVFPEEITCPETFRPLAWGNHPWFFHYRMQFQVMGFHKNGMRLGFTDEVRGVIHDLPVELYVVLPGVDTVLVKVRLEDVSIFEESRLHTCHATFIDPSEEFLNNISRYLFMAIRDLKLSQLDRAGYPFPEFEFASVFNFARTREEMAEVMKLRLDAYSKKPGSALAGVNDPFTMRDKYDDHALLLTLRVAGNLVGTGRIVFNDGDPDKSEIASLVPLPAWLWEKGFVEVSRAATVDHIRGRDVFPNLMRHMLRISYQCGVPYMLADCESHLLEPYKRRGAQELGLRFVHPLEGKTLHIIYYEVPALLKGAAGDPELWSHFWQPMARFIDDRHGLM